MDQKKRTIDNLSKVSLSLEAGDTADRLNILDAPRTLEFIFGIGSGGITPFEYRLAGKGTGEAVTVHIKPGAASAFFEHLADDVLQGIDATQPFTLSATVLDVTQPDNREVIRAMAEKSACGGGCDCGCGC